MGRPRPGHVRLNLDMPQTVRVRLESMSVRADVSMSEVIRRALATYDAMLDAQDRGGEVIIRESDGAERGLILVP